LKNSQTHGNKLCNQKPVKWLAILRFQNENSEQKSVEEQNGWNPKKQYWHRKQHEKSHPIVSM
jgi:hypothetical protein